MKRNIIDKICEFVIDVENGDPYGPKTVLRYFAADILRRIVKI